jgi:hypothetical protein
MRRLPRALRKRGSVLAGCITTSTRTGLSFTATAWSNTGSPGKGTLRDDASPALCGAFFSSRSLRREATRRIRQGTIHRASAVSKSAPVLLPLDRTAPAPGSGSWDPHAAGGTAARMRSLLVPRDGEPRTVAKARYAGLVSTCASAPHALGFSGGRILRPDLSSTLCSGRRPPRGSLRRGVRCPHSDRKSR